MCALLGFYISKALRSAGGFLKNVAFRGRLPRTTFVEKGEPNNSDEWILGGLGFSLCFPGPGRGRPQAPESRYLLGGSWGLSKQVTNP